MSQNALTTTSLLPATIRGSIIAGKTFVGIDFGTSTSVVSIASFDADQKRIHTNALRLQQFLPDQTLYSAEIVPTVIAWVNNRILVGEGASQLKYELKKGKNIWYSFKMELGEDLGSKYFESELKDIDPFFIKRPGDAARVFFSYLKFLIYKYCEEHGLSKDISYAVSIPASFEANQRKDLLDALEANDMSVSSSSLIDEPNAAFISYAVNRASEGRPMFLSRDYNSKVMVFDFGGGTCDISILEIGHNANGFFSKNIAISKFTKLGGDDIDRYLTYHYLMPRFFENNHVKASDFRTNERKRIASALLKVAERLKILVNKSLSTLVSEFEMPSLKNSDRQTSIRTEVVVHTNNKGELRQEEFYITNKEMTDTMSVFLKRGLTRTTRYDGEDEYNSIFSPIDSAIKKAHINKDELDYILLIGGSSKSPYIQEALHNYFEDSELLIPTDLQTHVSQGAAIHSLLFNGMGKCLIRPISSEPIIVVTQDAQPRIILPAGSQIPCSPITIDNLITNRNGQKTIELPICVGNASKQLFNLKIQSKSAEGFPANAQVKLTIEINADKMLVGKAVCMDSECIVEPMAPFANKELTTIERDVLKAERDANNESERNGGLPSKATLEKLRSAYEKVGKELSAAETYELQSELYPGTVNYNNLGVMYHNAGNHEKAAEWFMRGLKDRPNDATLHFNLGNTMKYIDNDVYKRHIQRALEIEPNSELALIESASIDASEGRTDEATQKRRRAYNILMAKWKAQDLQQAGYGWFASVAQELGEYAIAKQVRESKPTSVADGRYYNEENLTKTVSGAIKKYN